MPPRSKPISPRESFGHTLHSNGGGEPTREGGINSLEVYMANANTRVFNYNGRKLVSILGRESFSGERIYKLPTKVVEFANRQPLTSALLPCRIGYSPKAHGQKVSRPNGDWAFTLLFCVEGKGRLDLANTRVTLTPGTFAVIRPFEFHAYEADAVSPWSYYWIHFNGLMASQYYGLLTADGRHTVVKTEPDTRFVFSFERILNTYHSGHAYPMLVQAATALHQLLTDLYEMARREGEHPDIAARIEQIAESLRANPGMHVSVHELASIAHVSPAHFSREFRRRLGETPRHFVNQRRIEKACELLCEGHAKIRTIAQVVGFDDAAYFCRLFKRVTRRTPEAYREVHNKSAKKKSGSNLQ